MSNLKMISFDRGGKYNYFFFLGLIAPLCPLLSPQIWSWVVAEREHQILDH